MPNLRRPHARLLGDVGERAVAVVLVERVLRAASSACRIRRRRVDQEEVHPAVVVVVEERHPGPWFPAGSGSADIALSWTQSMPLTRREISSKSGVAAAQRDRHGWSAAAAAQHPRAPSREGIDDVREPQIGDESRMNSGVLVGEVDSQERQIRLYVSIPRQSDRPSVGPGRARIDRRCRAFRTQWKAGHDVAFRPPRQAPLIARDVYREPLDQRSSRDTSSASSRSVWRPASCDSATMSPPIDRATRSAAVGAPRSHGPDRCGRGDCAGFSARRVTSSPLPSCCRGAAGGMKLPGCI